MLPSDTNGCGSMRMLAERALYDWLVCVCVRERQKERESVCDITECV